MSGSRNSSKKSLGNVEGFLFDLDGTLVLTDRSLEGYQLLPGAIEVLTELKARSIPFVVFTNGTAYPAAEQAPKLRALGLPIADEALLTPSSVAADLMPRRGVKRALVLGTPGVARVLAEAGIQTLVTGQDGAEEAEAVYIGWHPDCCMKDIEAASGPFGTGPNSTLLRTFRSSPRPAARPWAIPTPLPLPCAR